MTDFGWPTSNGGVATENSDGDMKPFADLAETHISVVFFAGDKAYKLLKPIKLAFVDYSTIDRRLRAVADELSLNRRMAPDVYLGTADVMDNGELVDRFLVMRRLPEDRRLTELVDDPDWDNIIRQIARQVARFHAAQPPLSDVESIASSSAVQQNWEGNLKAIAPFVGEVIPKVDFEEVQTRFRTYLTSRDHLFDHRIVSGMVRDGHGDIIAQDIFCMDDGPKILDCLAFSRELRVADVLCDIAFLAMDLERIAGTSQARALMSYYAEYSNEHHPESLSHHYIAYRAHVRAKVACLRLAQEGGDVESESARLAAEYHLLCLKHLRQAQLRLVLIGGGPGTGKTTLASELSESHGWAYLNSDELRKDLSGYGHQTRADAGFGEGIYSEEFTALTYDTLISRAEVLLKEGESVVLDATWTHQHNRERAQRIADEQGASLVAFECQLPPEQAKSRIAARAKQAERKDASDATADIVDQALAERDSWPGAFPVDSSQGVDQAMGQVSAVLAQRLST